MSLLLLLDRGPTLRVRGLLIVAWARPGEHRGCVGSQPGLTLSVCRPDLAVPAL